MALVSETLPGFYNGESQQIASSRLPTQTGPQLNTHLSLVNGLTKRPNTELLRTITGSRLNVDTARTHLIQAANTEEYYMVVFTGDDTEPIEVYDLTGVKRPVTYAADKAYLQGTTPDKFRILNVMDYTFILNTTTTARLSSTVSPGSISGRVSNGAELLKSYWLGGTYLGAMAANAATLSQSGAYSDPIIMSLNFGSGLHKSDATYSDGIYAFEVYFQVRNAAGSSLHSERRTYTVIGNSQVNRDDITYNLVLAPPAGVGAGLSGKQYTITLKDKRSTGNFGAATSVTAYVAKGPTVFEITGDTKADSKSYYVKLTGVDQWDECVKPKTKNSFNPATMPHSLKALPDGSFTFAPNEWDSREVGDDDTVLVPSFVDKTINDIAFHRNRLCFVTDESIATSRVKFYFNLWGTSALETLADDPIDIGPSGKATAKLSIAYPFNRSLVLLGQSKQYDFHSGDRDLTPETATLDVITSFDVMTSTMPTAAGSSLYFVGQRDAHIVVREYLRQPDSLMEDAADITGHVDKLIPAGTVKLTATSSMDMLFTHTAADPKSLYVYKYYWAGSEKPQSAWVKWSFRHKVIGLHAINSTLYLLMQSDSGQILFEQVSLEIKDNLVNGGRVYLDDQLTCSAQVVGDETTFTVNAGVGDGTKMTVVDAVSGRAYEGTVSGSKVTVPYILTGGDYHIGHTYRSSFELTEWYVKNTSGNAVLGGRLMVRSVTLSVKDTGYYKVEVTPVGRQKSTKTFSGIQLGQSRLGELPKLNGDYRATVMTKSTGTKIEIVNDSHLPWEIHTASYEGDHVIRNAPL